MRNLAGAALIAATLAFAQTAAAGGCNDKASTLEIVECLQKQTASWDAVVEYAYEEAQRKSSGDVAKALREAQDLWRSYRDANCRVAALGEGSIAAVEAAECRLRMTTARAAELGGDEQPSAGADTAPGDAHADTGDEPPDGADPLPAQKIREVYTLLAADKLDNDHNPIMNPRLAKTFFAGPFLALWAKDQQCWQGDGTEGVVQMWVGGQDYQISDVRVTVPMGTADYQRVLATVTSFGKDQHWSYEFRRSGGAWLVHDVLLEGRSLSEAMKGGCAQ
jgi:uncharacterized protein YecT (DUF1311 family)